MRSRLQRAVLNGLMALAAFALERRLRKALSRGAGADRGSGPELDAGR